MNHLLRAVIFFAISCVPAFAQQAAAKEELPKIEQLQWMVGEWQTHEDDLLVRMSVRKSENGQAILYKVWFEQDGKSTQQYNGMYYWHPGEKTFK